MPAGIAHDHKTREESYYYNELEMFRSGSLKRIHFKYCSFCSCPRPFCLFKIRTHTVVSAGLPHGSSKKRLLLTLCHQVGPEEEVVTSLAGGIKHCKFFKTQHGVVMIKVLMVMIIIVFSG